MFNEQRVGEGAFVLSLLVGSLSWLSGCAAADESGDETAPAAVSASVIDDISPGLCPKFDPRRPNTAQCSALCKCNVGQGDCDADTDCMPGLACAYNVGAKYGFPADYDMCEAPPSCPTSPSTGLCNDPQCPCTYGQGDCDSAAECGGSLICQNHIGAAVGLPSNYDVCIYPTDVGCAHFNPASPNTAFCSPECPCDLGEGDCDGSADCRPGLICKNAVGAAYDLPANYDVCVRP